MIIAIDAYGGDNAPEKIVAGAVTAAHDFDCRINLVGNEKEIKKIIAGMPAYKNEKFREKADKNISFTHTDDVISVNDDPASVLHEKRGSSMGVCFDLLASGKADAMISAGSTGALLCGATFIVKRINGIKRPALACILPLGDKIVLDSGANPEVKPLYLKQFATMGSIYAKYISGIENPRIALLNNGTEFCKGTSVHKEAYRLLSEDKNFVGNIEGRDLFSDCCDVVVCDGFSGNIAIKSIEGSAQYFSGLIKSVFKSGVTSKLGYMFVRKKMRDFRRSLDYRESGGAPFLGVNKPVIKAHGNADEKTVYYTVKQAISLVKNDITGKVREKIKNESEVKCDE